MWQFPLIVQAPYEMHASGECTQRFVYLVPSLEATLASSSTRRSCGKRTVGVLEAHCPHSAGKLSRRAMEYGHRGHGWRLGGIKAKDGGGLLQTVEQGFEQLPHGCQGIRIEQRAHPLPQQALTAQLCPHRLEQGATQLLGLVDQERQHHEHGKHDRQMLLAMAVVVLKVIALVFERIEGLVFDFPPGSPPSHEMIHIALTHADVGHPAPVLDLGSPNL